MRKLAALTTLGLILPFAVAQESSPQMKALDFLLGEWSGTIKLTLPGSSDPMDIPTTVSVKSYGPFQETVYTMKTPGTTPFTGHMFLTYDGTAKAYKSWTFDNNTNEPRTEKGILTGKKLVMTSDPHGGVVTRVTFESKSEKEVSFLLEMKEGDDFKVLGSGTYTKTSS